MFVKGIMNKQEINHWLDNPYDYFEHLHGSNSIGKWKIYIGKSFGNFSITVYGYNGIKFGEIYIDNGVKSNGEYYPIIKFHNTLQGYVHGGRRVGNGLCFSIYPKDELITLEMLVKLIEGSWDIVKKFLNG